MSIEYDLNQIVNGTDNQTNFTTQLLKLIMKADGMNRVKLTIGFPDAVAAVVLFQETGEIRGFPSRLNKESGGE